AGWGYRAPSDGHACILVGQSPSCLKLERLRRVKVVPAPQRQRRHVLTSELPAPPLSGFPLRFHVSEVVLISHDANVSGWSVREGILAEQSYHVWRPLQQANHEVHHPLLVHARVHAGKPESPVETRLMRCYPWWRPVEWSRLILELVFEPGLPVLTAFQHQLE